MLCNSVKDLSKINKEEKKLIEEWKKTDFEEVNIESFLMPQRKIDIICNKISLLKGMLLVGSTSIGKSFMVLNRVKKNKVDFEYYKTHFAPTELFKELYSIQKTYEQKQNTENPFFLVIFDDMNVMNDEKIINILKGALRENNGKRIVEMHTIERILQETPKRFNFTGHIIIIANKINLKSENVLAIKDRTHYEELDFSYKEMLKIMSNIIKTDFPNTTFDLRKKALELIKETTDITTNELNFSTLIRAFDYLNYNPKQAKELLISTLNIDEEKKFVYELMKSNEDIETQVIKYKLETAKSRSSFYRIKQQINKELKQKI